MTVRRGPLPFPNTKSILFDGADDYLKISNSTVANTGQFTLSFWVKAPPKLTPSTANLISSPYYNINSFWSIGGSNFYWINVGNAPYLLANGVFDDTWHHIMVIFNPDNRPDINLGHIRCYVDGANVVDVNIGFTYAPGWNGGIYHGPIEFIGGNPGFGQKFVGKIDEFAAFEGNRESELTYIYNKGFPTNLNKLPVPPTAWYRMGDNGAYKDPQWLIPSNENKDKVSNYSMEFDGVDDYVGTDYIYPSTGDLSVSYWVKTISNSNPEYALSIGAYTLNSGIGKIGYHNTQGHYSVQYQAWDITHTSFLTWTATTPINLGEWYHILYVYDDSTSPGRLSVYINGQLQTMLGWNGVMMVTQVEYDINNLPLIIGALTRPGFGPSNFLNGNVDEISIFESNQSANVLTIYNNGTPNDLTPLNPVAWYRMGEEATFSGSYWTVPDEVGTNNATSSGMLIDARIGDAPNSTNNAVSLNMDFVDVVLDTP
jgi:hypothetical protein